MKFSSALLQAAAAVVLAAPFAFAQEAAQPVPTEFHVADPATDSLALSGTGTPIEAKPLLNRWVELSNFSHAERYRNAAESTGWHLFEDGQQRSILAGRVKLDNQARYTVNFRASSGTYFNWAFADYAGDGITTRGKEPGAFALYSPTELIGVLGAVAANPRGFRGI